MNLLLRDRAGQPWFHRWPAASIAVAALLYAGVFALRMTTGTPADATMLFFELPIALLAVTFGLVAGLAGGLIAVGLMVIWAVTEHIDLSLLGWVTRALPMLLLGVLVGRAADRLRTSEAERAKLDAAAHWHRQAVEINDSIVQGLSAAKWSLEAGKHERALETVTDTLDSAQTLVSQLLRDAELSPGAAHEAGSLSSLSVLAQRAKRVRGVTPRPNRPRAETAHRTPRP
ncbi:MAG: hypothetical protein BGO26_14035 [Actinobacteria bacterium 69-20]|nr:hypothetical protein [Actinomycetota bacterium]OJV29455.1 MAG: hypothetical protein BGO26_14035 [Actinobacteria bacterium 69-20]